MLVKCLYVVLCSDIHSLDYLPYTVHVNVAIDIHDSQYRYVTIILLELVFLCPVNLIRGVVEGEGFIRPVQAFMFLETCPAVYTL